MRKVGNCKHGTPCVYEIRNIKTNRVYIGSTPRFENRFREHRRLLTQGKHHSIRLQNSFNKHGGDSFEMKVVEIVSHKEFMIYREQFWIDRHGFKNTYNSKQKTTAGNIPKPIFSMCPITGSMTMYGSVFDACEKHGIETDRACQLNHAVDRMGKCRGMFWTRDNDETLEFFLQKKLNRKNHRKAYCVFAWDLNGSMIGRFKSQTDAANYYNLKSSSISRAIASGFKATCGSMLWSSIEVPPPASEIDQRRRGLQFAQIRRREREAEEKRVKVFKKRVVQIDRRSGRILAEYPSLSEAARMVPNATLTGVSEAANKKRAHHVGCIWEFDRNY